MCRFDSEGVPTKVADHHKLVGSLEASYNDLKSRFLCDAHDMELYGECNVVRWHLIDPSGETVTVSVGVHGDIFDHDEEYEWWVSTTGNDVPSELFLKNSILTW